MQEARDPRELVFATRGYYGRGRAEGALLYCESCADDLLREASCKARTFHITYNNCDTIVPPTIMQTTFLWLAILNLIISATVLIARGTLMLDYFVVALFAPTCGLAVLLAHNRFNDEDRAGRLLGACPHAASLLLSD